ncbi:hypothetical protein [Paludibacterium denitrificans]|uniref:Uncharacterized protein n=1 Tax=Paludibacterium denitrificans TaxID=2675226 RepID=A0A844GF79_9NEIS|nr:hypothetical protein [Paludibacterium denitrificans]MTD33878.1 hypothetical protein [Paludibacterium denitrificans]
MELETVKITAEITDLNPLGYIIINKSDLTEDHVLFDESNKKSKGKKEDSADDTKTDEQDGNEGV